MDVYDEVDRRETETSKLEIVCALPKEIVLQ